VSVENRLVKQKPKPKLEVVVTVVNNYIEHEYCLIFKFFNLAQIKLSQQTFKFSMNSL